MLIQIGDNFLNLDSIERAIISPRHARAEIHWAGSRIELLGVEAEAFILYVRKHRQLLLDPGVMKAVDAWPDGDEKDHAVSLLRNLAKENEPAPAIPSKPIVMTDYSADAERRKQLHLSRRIMLLSTAFKFADEAANLALEEAIREVKITADLGDEMFYALMAAAEHSSLAHTSLEQWILAVQKESKGRKLEAAAK